MIKPSHHVRLLGVTIAADLSLDRHVSDVCKTYNSVLSSALRKVTDKLQHVQNAAAWLVTEI